MDKLPPFIRSPWLEAFLRDYGYDTEEIVQQYTKSAPTKHSWKTTRSYEMTATKVMLPDGSEQNAADVICEGCNESMATHACAIAGAAGGGGTTVVASRSTGPRKDPKDRPLCPHCHGAVHFSMPGSLQNYECLLRQMYVDKGTLTDPFARLPIGGMEQMRETVDWYDSLRTPVSYGRMETAAGGAGTYGALRPKADPTVERKPRAKKQKAAEAGEKIEDIAKDVVATTTAATPADKKAERAAKRAAKESAAVAAAAPAMPVYPSPAAPVVQSPPIPVGVAPMPTSEINGSAMSAEERQARRQALLGKRRGV